jgi:hypothetical protein
MRDMDVGEVSPAKFVGIQRLRLGCEALDMDCAPHVDCALLMCRLCGLKEHSYKQGAGGVLLMSSARTMLNDVSSRSSASTQPVAPSTIYNRPSNDGNTSCKAGKNVSLMLHKLRGRGVHGVTGVTVVIGKAVYRAHGTGCAVHDGRMWETIVLRLQQCCCGD